MSSVSESTTMIQPTLHHINLKTKRLQEMIDWYSTVVGMKSTYQFPGGAWLTNDRANHRLALLTSPQLSEDPDKLIHTGIHHASLDHGMTTSFYYEDPDGNSVELQSDNFGTWEESSEWMRTSPQFAADPIGMPVDPEQMVAAHQAGASFAELHKRAYAGEFKPSGPLDLHVPLGDPRAPL